MNRRCTWLVLHGTVVALSIAGTSSASPERVDEFIKTTLQLDPNVDGGASCLHGFN